MKQLLTGSLCLLLTGALFAQTPVVDSWTYIQIDENKAKWGDWDAPEWLRYFGLDMGDIDGDGDLDIVSGRHVYRNPGGEMTGHWERVDLPDNVDAILLMDVDGDEYADIIAQALPRIYWFEAEDEAATAWGGIAVGSVPATSHVNSQGFEKGQLIGGGREEFVIAGDGNVYVFEIPENPYTERWKRTLIAENTSDEGMGLGDLDGDGDLDLATGRRPAGGDEPLIVVTYTNPGSWSGKWESEEIGVSNHPIDRVEISDLNGDGRGDIVISEERYPGLEPDGNLFWYENPADGEWTRHRVVTQYSMNNLDLLDADEDGDVDLLTAEHKGPGLELQIWKNDGSGIFTKEVIDTGKENHLGTQVADLDGDGDLDIVGAGWDEYRFMHVWRNDWIDNRFSWELLSSESGELPKTNGSDQQTASLVVDVNKDGKNDIFITDRSTEPSVIGLLRTETGWDRYVIDAGPLRIEAGSTSHDIDGDGDIDIVFGGEGQSNAIWWWENPYPDLEPDRDWVRRTIKKSGENKHHDQKFIDFDGDGQVELVYWNQSASSLFFSDIPEDPRSVDEWDRQPIYTYGSDGEMEARSSYPIWRGTHEHEGLFAMDMNDDGVDDIVGGGRWFEFVDGQFIAHIVDASYTFTRAAAGQLIEGGRPEIILTVGDGIGPLVMYEWKDGFWESTELLQGVDNGHTLDVLDFDGDGHLDIFNAEMRFGEGNPDSEVRILLGDGTGRFTKHVVARGYGVHEGQLVDLDGDGDLDVLGKPYTWKAPLLNIWLQKDR